MAQTHEQETQAMNIITITNIKASAKALGYDEAAGGIVTQLCGEGLVLTATSIAFPEHLLNSVTWVVAWKHEILFDEERAYQTKDEINEMRALKRLLDRLKAMGGQDVLEFEDGEWKPGCGPQNDTPEPTATEQVVDALNDDDEDSAGPDIDENGVAMYRLRISAEAWENELATVAALSEGRAMLVKHFGLDNRRRVPPSVPERPTQSCEAGTPAAGLILRHTHRRSFNTQTGDNHEPHPPTRRRGRKPRRRDLLLLGLVPPRPLPEDRSGLRRLGRVPRGRVRPTVREL